MLCFGNSSETPGVLFTIVFLGKSLSRPLDEYKWRTPQALMTQRPSVASPCFFNPAVKYGGIQVLTESPAAGTWYVASIARCRATVRLLAA